MHQIGQRQIAIGRIAPEQSVKSSSGQSVLDRSNAVGAFWFAGGRNMVGIVGLADE